MPPTYIYVGQRRVLVDPKAYVGGQRRDIALGYSYTGGQRRLVFSREPVVASAAGSYWDTVTVTWVLDSYVPDEFRLFDAATGGTELYRGPLKLFTHTLRLPSTSYTYRVEAWLGGNLMSSSTATTSTPAHSFDSFTAGAASYSVMQLRWTDSQQRSIDRYDLYRDGVGLIDSGADKAHDDGGLAEQTWYGYDLYAIRGGAVIGPKVRASAQTPARPQSSAIWYGPSVNTSGYNYAQSTAKQLFGPNFSFVGGTNYVSGFNWRINGYSGSTGKFYAHMGGHNYPTYYPTGTGTGDVQWTWVDGENRQLGNGPHGCYVQTGGDANYRSQWQTHTGGTLGSNCAVGQVNYWWYSAREARDVRRVELGDGEGGIVAFREWDKETGDLVDEGGDLPSLDARIEEG